MAVFYAQFEFDVEPGHPLGEEVVGGWVQCWVSCDTVEKAVEIARSALVAEKIMVDQADDSGEVHREKLQEDQVEYYDQAIEEGAIFAFHCYVEGDEEDGDEDEFEIELED